MPNIVQTSKPRDDSAPLKISRLSSAANPPKRVIGVFAHNEAATIEQALKSIVNATPGKEIAVFVLANGCRDETTAIAKSCADFLPDLSLIEIDLADKANAWNLFIHDVFSDDEAAEIETWFFMDGDVELTAEAMLRLDESLEDSPHADAAGGMPGSGREMEFRRQQMVAAGMLAGNFYALRGTLINRMRQADIRMPIGLIGEDFFVSWILASVGWESDIPNDKPSCIFNGSAEFIFRSLNPFSFKDCKFTVNCEQLL